MESAEVHILLSMTSRSLGKATFEDGVLWIVAALTIKLPLTMLLPAL
ncbi:hypothetical protein PSYAR_17305 [Pseudomonas syringae pv. aceris str. M302273]|nr:hypothetical protein PSYAR_17305 [Pseudomonas syringae pv. aceris str. M302273]